MPQQIIETEESLIIETPERVPLAFALASIGNRFLAAALDHFIQFFTIGIVIFIFLAAAGTPTFESGESFLASSPKWMIAIMIIILFLLFAGYFIFFEWIWNGQTPGKRLIGVAALVTIAALAACLVPGRRALRVDPLLALRAE